MEIIGRYTVRNVAGEKLIKAPPGAWGEYILEIHDDGSFAFRPAEGQLLAVPCRYHVWDPEGKLDTVSFSDEKKALTFKEKLEREYGRIFRMKKVFKSIGNKTIAEES